MILDNNEEKQKELIFNLSECIDFYIKTMGCSDKDIPENDHDLKVLYDILSALNKDDESI